MFRPEVAIIRFSSKYLRVKIIYSAGGCAGKAYISLTLNYFEVNLMMATSGQNM
jgi:hypothetical protein